MTCLFAESGGNYHFNTATGPGVWAAAPSIQTFGTPYTGGNTYSYNGGGSCVTNNLGTQSALIAGFRCFVASLTNNLTIIQYKDGSGNVQCDLRMNNVGQLFFTRNGTNLGAGNPSLSTGFLTTGNWHYIEYKAIFATSATGTCEVFVDGTLFLTLTNVQNANNTANAQSVVYLGSGQVDAMADFYVINTSGSLNNTYLGDVTVAEIYDNGAGVNSAWSVNQGSFTLTSVANASGGTTVYTGTITNGGSNNWQGSYFTISGFTNGANNGTWLCTASSTTTITLANAAGVSETHAATCAFQNPLQPGIHGGVVDGYATTNVGTRPPVGSGNGTEIQYIFSSTTGQKTDYAHQALTLTGAIAAVIHTYQARKDDAGTRQMAGFCLSNAVESDGATQTLTTTESYYSDIYETDPNTSTGWTLSGFNAATFGFKEIT